MTVLAGAYDPRGGRWARRLAAAIEGDESQVVQVGWLTVAGSEAPARHGSITCLLTGELHDLAELARSLSLTGATSPAAMVAAGFSQRGTGFLEQLRGAYQLVLWDDLTQRATLSADHLSARTLFYAPSGSAWCFASDLGELQRALPVSAPADPDTVPRWITDRSLPQSLTLYRGVNRLPMGHALILEPGRLRLEPVWRPRYSTPEPVGLQDAATSVRAAVRRAVQRRLTVDGRTGILLSGGFDSAALAGTAASLLADSSHTLPSYSTIFPGESWDESPGVRLLVSEHNLPSTQLRVHGGTIQTALRFQDKWGLPQLAPGSILDSPLLERAHRDGMRVMFDGQGGDELFAASPYLLTDQVLSGRLRAAWHTAHRFPGVDGSLKRWQAEMMARRFVAKGALPHWAHGLSRQPSEYSALEWLTPHSRRIAEGLDDPWAWKRGRDGAPRWWAFLAFLLVDAREFSGIQDFLRRRGSLAGIDAREPLLTDVDLVELMLRVPPQLAFSPHYDRALAREAMRGIVPEPIRVPERKSDYSGLMQRILAGRDLAQLHRILEAPDAEVGAYVDLPRMRAAFLGTPPQGADPAWAHRIWGLATTELWLRSLSLGDGFGEWVGRLGVQPVEIETLVAPSH